MWSVENPYFLPYQRRWLADRSRMKIWEKSRRIGATYAQSYEDVRDCVENPATNVWFSSADESAAREYIALCERWTPRKFLVARHNPTYENPYGERVLARVFWPVAFKKAGLRFWLTCVEKFSVPYLVGKHPRGMGAEEIAAIARRLEDAVQDAVLVIPDDASVDIKEAAHVANGTIFQQLKQTCDEDIAIAILGQNLTTSVRGGSLSAAQVHDRVRGEIKNSDKKIAARAINQLIRWFVELNFGDAPAPAFAFDTDIIK